MPRLRLNRATYLAGKAVIGHVIGLLPKAVSLDKPEPQRSAVPTAHDPSGVDGVAYYLSGSLAESYFDRGNRMRLLEHAEADNRQALSLGRELYQAGWGRAESLIHQHGETILRLAFLLLEHGSLTADEVHRAIVYSDWRGEPEALTAVHESAHVTASNYFRLWCMSATIVPVDDRAGHVDRLRTGTLDEEMIVALAGTVAEAKFLDAGTPLRPVAAINDLKNIAKLVDEHYGRPVHFPESTDFFKQSLATATALVEKRWPRILFLAEQLMRYKTLGCSALFRLTYDRPFPQSQAA